VVGGLIVLAVVLAVASAAGFVLRQRQGRFRSVPAGPGPVAGPAVAAGPEPSQAKGQPQAAGSALNAADLGAPLGARATLVQFSTEVCAYCGPTRELLTEAAAERDGVAFVEIDAAARMDLTRRLHVLSTPTVLVLDAAGAIVSRASGPLRKADLISALGHTLHAGEGVS
jgi:hypothetical protein